MAKTRSWFRNGFLILALLSVALIVPVVCFAAESEISLLDESQTEYKLTYDSGEFAVSSTGTLQLHIIQTADGEDISDRVIWLSSAPNIAAIDKNGLVSGKKVGEAEISCLSLDGKTTFVKASIKVVAGVESAALSDSKLTLLLGAGNEKAAAALSYTVQPENAYFQGATWISSDESVAIVDASGKVNAVGAGTCLISAISEDSGFATPVSCEITVLQAVSQISISAEDILWTGSTQKIAPVISPEDASVQNVLWESSDPSVATVDASGNVRSLTVGTATVKCISTDGSGVFGECAVRVEAKTQSIDFIEKTVSLLIGAGEDHSTMVLTLSTTPADAYYQTATWTSSDENVVTVDAQGRLQAVSEGCAQITAVSDDPDCKTAAKCNVVVSKAVQSIVLDEVEQTAYTAATVKLHADVGPDDAANKRVIWETSDPSIAAVDANGNVRCLSVGTCSITCTAADGSGVASTCELNIIAKVAGLSLSEKNVTLLIGAGDEKLSTQLSCTVIPTDALYQNVVWASCDESIVTVDPDGTLHAVGIGKAVVSATSEDPEYTTPAVCNVTVDQAVLILALDEHDATIYTGDALKLCADVSPDSATNKGLLWMSSDPDVAAVDTNGNVKGLSVGSAEIVCMAADGSEVTDKCTVTVRAKVKGVKLDQSNLQLAVGNGDEAATGHIGFAIQPEDAYIQTVTWMSSDESIVTVDATGTVRAIGEGIATVSAVSDDPDCGASASCQIVVGKAVTSIRFADAKSTMNLNSSQSIKTEVLPADAANKKLTWESTDPNVAAVDANGRVCAVGNGTADIICSATDGTGVKQTIRITVITPVSSIVPSQREGFILVGGTAKLSVTVNPENATNKEVKWETDSSCVTVSADGVITGVRTGTATVTATAKDGSGAACSVKVTVEPEVPVELSGLQYGTTIFNYGTLNFTFRNLCSSVGVSEIVYTVRLSGTAFLLTKSENTFTISGITVYPGRTISDSNYFPKYSDARHITVTIESVTLSDGTEVICGESYYYDIS